MADDYYRVFIKIDGEEKAVQMSATDLKLGLQSMWLSDMDKGWTLLESRLPGLMTQAMKAYEAEKEEAERKVLEKHGVNKVNPLRAFIARNWGWAVTIVVLVMLLRPDLGKHLIGFVF